MMNAVFQLGGEGTGLQRDLIIKKIKGKVVVWIIQVYEISKVKSDGMVTIRSLSGTISRENQLKYYQLIKSTADIGSVVFENSQANEIPHNNQNVGTDIELSMRNDADLQYLSSLKTGDWILIRGKISDSSWRSIELSPAVIESVDNVNNYNKILQLRNDIRN